MPFLSSSGSIVADDGGCGCCGGGWARGQIPLYGDFIMTKGGESSWEF